MKGAELFVIRGLTCENGRVQNGPGGACDANPVLTRPSAYTKGGLR